MKCPCVKLLNYRLEEKRMNSFGSTNCLPNSQHKFVSNGAGVNYSILLGQCAPLLGVRGGLDGTG